MPLSLLAKDSIQDLTALAEEGESATAQQQKETSPSSIAEAAAAAAFVEGQESIVGVRLPSSDDDGGSNAHRKDGDEMQQSIPSNEDSDLGASQMEDTAESTGPQHVQQTEQKGENLPVDDLTQIEDLATGANPQQAQPEKSTPLNEETAVLPVPYAGFRQDYYENRYHYGATQGQPPSENPSTSPYYYHHDTYAAPTILGNGNDQPIFPKLLFCLFPWMTRQQPQQTNTLFQPQTYEQETFHESTSTANGEGGKANTKAVSTSPDDECSNGSDALGEKLSAKERNAVLARLGLPQPDQEPGASSSSNQSKRTPDKSGNRSGLLNGIPTYDTSPLESSSLDNGEPKKLKGILKSGSGTELRVGKAVPASLSSSSVSNGSLSGGASNINKRDEQSVTPKRRSLFPSYKTPVNKTRTSMHHVQFAPMARVVTVKSKNDMSAEEKGDVWWQKSDYEDFRRTGRIITKAIMEGGSEIWLNQSKPSISTSSKNSEDDDDINGEQAASSIGRSATAGDKWWHRFGHSRRGLEHVVSVQEGRERQINVRTAIRAVLEEQARQKMYRREDAEKLRAVSFNYTSWARDLALASGSSDADAVKSEFSAERKSREFYLLKMARSTPQNKVALHHVPTFMQPAVRVAAHAASGNSAPTKNAILTQPHLLDANTAAQISFRRRKVYPTESEKIAKEISCEPLNDAKGSSHSSTSSQPSQPSLASRAAGFSVDGEKVDMAAVLSGMGAIPQESSTASATAVVS